MQLPLKREDSNFKREAVSSRENVGRQVVVYMEEMLIVELGFFQLFCYV